MSAAKGVLSLQEEDLTKILVATAHLGSANLDFQMEQYVFKRKNNGKIDYFYRDLIPSCWPIRENTPYGSSSSGSK